MWRAERARKTVGDVSGSWQISPKYTGYTLADPIVVKNNATLAYKEIVTANGLSYGAAVDRLRRHPQRTPPAEGVAPPTAAPTAPSPEPAPEP